MKKAKVKQGIMGILVIIAALGSSLLFSKAEMRTVYAAAGEVEINETNFPDQVFREYVEQFDTDGNGAFSDEELSKVSKIDVENSGITDLTGIEYFYNLVTLRCGNNNLSSLDVSNNTELQIFACNDNNLESLDLSNNKWLSNLDCGQNNLKSIDVENNVRLTTLICPNNNLSSIDVSKNTRLEALFCEKNNLSSLDVSNNPKITDLSFSGNKITSINLSKNTELLLLYCYDNNLSSLDISSNTKLENLYCQNNNLSNLDLSNNTRLYLLYCYGNHLSSIDISNTSITESNMLSCDSNITVPLYKDGDKYYIDLTEFSFDKEKFIYRDTGTYNSENCRIEFEEILAVGDTVSYYYITGLKYVGSDNDFFMAVNIKISNIIDLNVPELTQPIVGTPNNTAAGVNVTWTKTAGATGYYIFRRVSGGSWSWIGTAEGENTLSYTDTKAVGGTVYAYTVRAYYKDSAGKYYYSTYNTTGKGVIRLTEPTVNTPTNAASGINVTWTKTAGATGYYIFRRASGESFSWIGTATGTSTLSYVDTTAKAGTVYAYTVRAYYKNSAGTIYYSSYDTTGKGGIRLIAPAMKLSAATGKVTVSWTKTTGALGYYIYRKTETGSWMLVATIKSGNTLSYADTTAKAGTKYYYAMKAYYGGYTSVWSNIPGVTAK